MGSNGHTVTLGQLLDEIIEDAERRWCADHARGMEPELFSSRNLRHTFVSMSVGRTGQLLVWVTINARHQFDSATYGYRIFRQGNRRYAPGYKPAT